MVLMETGSFVSFQLEVEKIGRLFQAKTKERHMRRSKMRLTKAHNGITLLTFISKHAQSVDGQSFSWKCGLLIIMVGIVLEGTESG